MYTHVYNSLRAGGSGWAGPPRPRPRCRGRFDFLLKRTTTKYVENNNNKLK